MNPAFILLPIILYLGGYFLDLEEIKKNKFGILISITLGVASKIISVGLILQLFFPGVISWILACILGQIDPGATLFFRKLRPKNVSKKYETLSGAMSSFDDPMTALIALFILPFALNIPAQLELRTYIINFIIVGILIGFSIIFSEKLRYLIVSVYLFFSSFLQATVSAGILGLFVKPDKIHDKVSFNDIAQKAVPVLFFISLASVIFSLQSVPARSEIIMGIVAGALMFGAQIFTGHWIGLLSGLNSFERRLFSFDQFNGITSSTLALFFSPIFPEIIPLTLASLATITTLYIVFNFVFLRWFDTSKVSVNDTERSIVTVKNYILPASN